MKSLHKYAAAALAGLLAAVTLAVVAQNVDLRDTNYRFGSVGIGVPASGTPGDLRLLATGAAPAGAVGEVLSVTVAAASGVTQLSATPVNITSLSLTPGDWEITGACSRTLTGVTATIYGCSLSGTTGTLSTQPAYTAGNLTCGAESLVTQSATWGTTVTGRFDTRVGPLNCRVVTAATTIFLVVGDTFSAGTMTTGTFGGIKARRIR